MNYKDSNSITFISDSITEGTKNGCDGASAQKGGDHTWYEPIINFFHNKKIKIFLKVHRNWYSKNLKKNN